MRINKYKLVLASKSPRRQYLLEQLGLQFEIRSMDVDESFPAGLRAEEIALFLAKKKSDAYMAGLGEGELLITADTIVWIGEQVLNKPADEADARRMLRILSGNMHKVYTGVSICTLQKTISFHAETKVFFRDLKEEEIEYYITNYKPFDKAGAYGAQDWIGLVGVSRIEGSYFNVMGLPVYELYSKLLDF